LRQFARWRAILWTAVLQACEHALWRAILWAAVLQACEHALAHTDTKFAENPKAAGFLTLAAFVKYPCKHGYFPHCSRE
jgi:hypothetical protein